jgi:predicted nucleic acid-binding Zn finger protein
MVAAPPVSAAQALLDAVAGELAAALAERARLRAPQAAAASAAAGGAAGAAGAAAGLRAAEERAQCAALALDALVGHATADRAMALAFAGQSRARLGVRAWVSKDAHRECWHVRGGDEAYVCLRGFCGCVSFEGRLPGGGSGGGGHAAAFPLCKHLVAVSIAEAAGVSQRQEVSEEAFSRLVLEAS